MIYLLKRKKKHKKFQRKKNKQILAIFVARLRARGQWPFAIIIVMCYQLIAYCVYSYMGRIIWYLICMRLKDRSCLLIDIHKKRSNDYIERFRIPCVCRLLLISLFRNVSSCEIFLLSSHSSPFFSWYSSLYVNSEKRIVKLS